MVPLLPPYPPVPNIVLEALKKGVKGRTVLRMETDEGVEKFIITKEELGDYEIVDGEYHIIHLEWIIDGWRIYRAIQPEELTREEFEELIRSDPSMRSYAASNPRIPRDLIFKLAEDESKWVRLWVAKNPSTPPEVLLRLARDDDEDVRNAALKNPNCPRQAYGRAMLE